MKALALAALLACLAAAPAAHADPKVKELARIKGHGESILQGYGLVMGLPGTGDSGKDAVLARPLAKILENNHNAPETLKELASSKTVALVMVMCRTPAAGSRADDKFDVTITAINNASSLKGGVLYVTPLTDPRPGGEVYAFAQGKIELEDTSTPTTGKVREGAQLVRDIPAPRIEGAFEILLDPPYAGWSSAQLVASAINEWVAPLGPAAASAVDERTIRVEVPEHERTAQADFLHRVMTAEVPASRLNLAAQVVCNARTGVIVVTGDVEISPGIISHKDLVITTTIPAPQPTPQDPATERHRWAPVQTNARPKDKAKLGDLLSAFKQLDIPPAQQIEVIQLLHKSGRLHAKLIVE
ncbi:MAG: flagellar basal body P-ring protein FlgI [Phycisphaeraceae bacterium]|nr:MAG: flagellar basal body P-ring protein FlgI [Phycisphaeraceae bacterium]